jgi:restriction endonuclease S subunit
LKTTLQNIASIQSGIYVKPDSFGNIVYLQGKHFNENGQLNTSLIPDLQLTNQTERHLLQHGDILIAAKGNKNFATVYEERNGLCVASSTFMVIRIKPNWKKKISSEFLSWYINHPNTQLWLKTNSIGSAVQSISKVTLSEMELLIPNIDKQHSILKINALKKLEQSIQKQLADLKEQYVQQLLLTSLN